MADNSKKNSRFFILLAGLTFCFPLALLYAYSHWSNSLSIFGIELKKMVQNESNPKIDNVKPILEDIPLKKFKRELIHVKDSTNILKENNRILNQRAIEFNENEEFFSVADSISNINLDGLDSINHRVVIIGDSECGGLCFQLNDYCQENGHKLMASVVWNSASIFNFAYSDTITNVIKKYKPTYIFIVVGLNELYAKDLRRRRKAAQILAKKISGIPYTWIGPANFSEDNGINQVFAQSAEQGTYYLTKQLTLPKGFDKRHPSTSGYRIWMDSLAVWAQTKAKYKIRLKPPAKRNRRFRSKIINLNAVEYRGY